MKTITLAVILCLCQTACVKHVPLTTAQTIQLSTAKTLGTIAELNRGVISLSISLNKSKVISDKLTATILDYAGTVASSTTAAIVIQQGTSTDAQKADAVLAALRKIQLPPELAAYINSSNAPAEAAGLISLINAVASVIQLLTGGK